MKNENQQTVVNDSVDRDEEKASWDLYTVHYPFSGERVAMTRFLCWGDDYYVIQVLDLKQKKGRVLAEAQFRNGPHGLYFNVTPDHWGHVALCRLLKREGVGGRYKKWLKAIDAGDEETAREYADSAYIRFSIELTNEKEEDWDIDTTIHDSAEAEQDATREPTIEEFEAQIQARKEAANNVA